jgi:hypothetical protein
MGQVYATWDNAGTAFSDVSSPDLNGSTTAFTWRVNIVSGNVELQSSITAGTWDILVATRVIF